MNWRAFQAKQQVVELGERFVSYLDEGTGEAMLFLHGIPTWGFLWHKVVTPLSRTHRIIVPDLLGFGFSDKRDCFDRSIARQAQWMDALLTTLGLDRVAVVGHDIGGGVALRLATFFPRRVTRLCLMNSVCYDSWPIEVMLQFGHPGGRRKLSVPAAHASLKQALKMGFEFTPDDELLDGLLAPWTTEVGKVSLIRNAAALNTNLTTEITPLLSRIQVPTLVLWGTEDKFQLAHYGERLAADIPEARFIPLKQAGHFLMFDKPDQVLSELVTFLGATGDE
jgi:pimeloyl-ACP methyl ester carboxylesterase